MLNAVCVSPPQSADNVLLLCPTPAAGLLMPQPAALPSPGPAHLVGMPSSLTLAEAPGMERVACREKRRGVVRAVEEGRSRCRAWAQGVAAQCGAAGRVGRVGQGTTGSWGEERH